MKIEDLFKNNKYNPRQTILYPFSGADFSVIRHINCLKPIFMGINNKENNPPRPLDVKNFIFCDDYSRNTDGNYYDPRLNFSLDYQLRIQGYEIISKDIFPLVLCYHNDYFDIKNNIITALANNENNEEMLYPTTDEAITFYKISFEEGNEIKSVNLFFIKSEFILALYLLLKHSNFLNNHDFGLFLKNTGELSDSFFHSPLLQRYRPAFILGTQDEINTHIKATPYINYLTLNPEKIYQFGEEEMIFRWKDKETLGQYLFDDGLKPSLDYM